MKKPRIMSLEEALQYLDDDEYCEVTPESIRFVRKFLIKTNVKRQLRRKNSLNNHYLLGRGSAISSGYYK